MAPHSRRPGAEDVPAAAGPPTALKSGPPAFQAGIQAGLDALRAKQAAKRAAKDASAEEAEARGHSRW